ncbi:MAG: hypothetical protein WD063_16370 [Pirellulales bacterium]
MAMHTSDVDLVDELKPRVMTLRMIVGALAGGVMAFAALAVLTRAAAPQEPVDERAQLLTLLALGLFPVALLASRILPAVMVKKARRQIGAGFDFTSIKQGPGAFLSELGEAGALVGVYRTKTIIAAAVLEGAALFGVFAFLLEGSLIALGLAVLLVAAIVAMFPSASRIAGWIERQLRQMDEEKLLVR